MSSCSSNRTIPTTLTLTYFVKTNSNGVRLPGYVYHKYGATGCEKADCCVASIGKSCHREGGDQSICDSNGTTWFNNSQLYNIGEVECTHKTGDCSTYRGDYAECSIPTATSASTIETEHNTYWLAPFLNGIQASYCTLRLPGGGAMGGTNTGSQMSWMQVTATYLLPSGMETNATFMADYFTYWVASDASAGGRYTYRSRSNSTADSLTDAQRTWNANLQRFLSLRATGSYTGAASNYEVASKITYNSTVYDETYDNSKYWFCAVLYSYCPLSNPDASTCPEDDTGIYSGNPDFYVAQYDPVTNQYRACSRLFTPLALFVQDSTNTTATMQSACYDLFLAQRANSSSADDGSQISLLTEANTTFAAAAARTGVVTVDTSLVEQGVTPPSTFPEFACANADLYPEFKILSSTGSSTTEDSCAGIASVCNQPSNKGCWWIACVKGSSDLAGDVPGSQFVYWTNADESQLTKNCSCNFCGNIICASDASQINIGTASQTAVCSSNSSTDSCDPTTATDGTTLDAYFTFTWIGGSSAEPDPDSTNTYYVNRTQIVVSAGDSALFGVLPPGVDLTGETVMDTLYYQPTDGSIAFRVYADLNNVAYVLVKVAEGVSMERLAAQYYALNCAYTEYAGSDEGMQSKNASGQAIAKTPNTKWTFAGVVSPEGELTMFSSDVSEGIAAVNSAAVGSVVVFRYVFGSMGPDSRDGGSNSIEDSPTAYEPWQYLVFALLAICVIILLIVPAVVVEGDRKKLASTTTPTQVAQANPK